MDVRDATDDDLPAILEIYNDAVATTTAVWNERATDLAERRRWREGRVAAGYPVLVAVAGGAVLGFASFAYFRAWDGYRHTVEHSVYVRSDARGRGVGSALMPVLIERAQAAGKHVMVAGVEAGNEASLALHRRFGFREAGRLHEVGTKFGRWLDLVFLELRLDDRPADPR